ncbi:patatin-like phospholipase family protein [Oscillospiraceae bacterium MB08-C2-2]|nr:patatin-like phospholipase family protein [Oscillospiraceae bacterium MB08-C2-2]
MKRGIVLAGGGSRGPYEIGVWQALRELEISFDIVTGTSVGALNGALMVQGSFEQAKALWQSISSADVISGLPAESTMHDPRLYASFLRKAVEQGGMDTTPLEETLRRIIDEDAFRQSPIEYALVTVEYPSFRPVNLTKEQIPQGKLVDYLLASSACFPAFRQREIDGSRFIDGSYYDVMPVNLAVECGAEEIIAVDLHSLGLHPQVKAGYPITIIQSHWDLGIFLVFDPAIARRNMVLGYQDAMKAFRRLEGKAYTFFPGETARNALVLSHTVHSMRRRFRELLLNEASSPSRDLALYRLRKALSLTDKQKYGRLMTQAAETAGEIFQLDPARSYSFGEFNRCLLTAVKDRTTSISAMPKLVSISELLPLAARETTLWLLDALRQAYHSGSVPPRFWRRAAVSTKESVAALYLFILELSRGI